jgi:hypothetical protein
MVGEAPAAGRGGEVGGLAARGVLVPPLPQPQLVQLDGDQPMPPLRQPAAANVKARQSDNAHRESE